MNDQQVKKFNGMERREVERVKININKIFAAEILLPDKPPLDSFIYIKDISRKGVKIHLDSPFPNEENMGLRLFLLDEPIEIKIRLVWQKQQKQLPMGMYGAGLEFLEISQESIDKINDFINKYAFKEGKKIPTPSAQYTSQILLLEAQAENFSENFYISNHDLNLKGMRITYDKKFPENTELNLKLLLEFYQPSLELKAKVSSQRKTFLGDFIINLEFTQISEKDILRIKKIIDWNFYFEEEAL
ncbi:MAG: PilZ domain-containing protein [Armatimonadetes bacterium]|nr:PilZ domain-containing protein [Armatimonadota bacterium]